MELSLRITCLVGSVTFAARVAGVADAAAGVKYLMSDTHVVGSEPGCRQGDEDLEPRTVIWFCNNALAKRKGRSVRRYTVGFPLV